ncbi:MAG: hypothetical protein K6V36_06950, partial [Anaerolineae bacterium]|nr:hypothetical protein [Anaerolineae bacterium]
MTDPVSDTAVVNRCLVVGVGRFGARVLAHLWQRLRFQDAYRPQARRRLPRLQDVVAMALLLPDSASGIVIGRPDPAKWATRDVLRRIASGSEERSGARDILATLAADQQCLGKASGESREAWFEVAVDCQRALGDYLTLLADRARVEGDAPGVELQRFPIYVIAALDDPHSSALLWPLVMVLRERLAELLALDIQGLLSCGAYAERPEDRRQQGARIHPALLELEFFSGEKSELSHLPSSPEKIQRWQGQPFFDQCYLIDSEKRSGTRVRDEDEVVATLGNALEVLLISNATDVIAECVGPDAEILQRRYPFATLGAANTYIPIDEWQARSEFRLALEILDTELLKEEHEPLPADSPAASLLARCCDLPALVAEMVQDCPFRMLEPGSRGDTATLFQRARLERPLTDKDGPGLPLPEVMVDPQYMRPSYCEEDPVEGRRRRLPPEAWIERLYRHFRELGLDPPLIFPGDPEIERIEAQIQAAQELRQREAAEAGASSPLGPGNRFAEWHAAMIRACDDSAVHAEATGAQGDG